ncbi:MAG TPA: xanthine dehydrogenase family protein molybdopterin-binding subunit [Acidimicrobiales bacterium]|nr:xanthine dehydrogenase family protein molybdopterin-binding subunit [Acidimicrobiales bacterium]
MTVTVLGHEVRRSEDPDLLTGRARFLADLGAEGLLEAVFVRSAVAHGTIRAIDTSDVAGAPGVHSVWTAADLDLPPLGQDGPLARPLLATDRVRFAGEPVAVILADSYAAALDAAESVVVDIEALPVVIDPCLAAEDGSPQLFPDHGTNVVGGRHHPEDASFFDGADVVASARLVHNRVAPVTIEPNGVLAQPGADGALEVWVSTQSVFGVRGEVARTLGVDPQRVRVRAPWVGGGFGAKGGVYNEALVVAALAHRLGRALRWVETRSENLVNMTHGRGQVTDVEVGATREGRLVALRVRSWADVGAYPVRGTFIPMVTRFMSAGVYPWERHDFSAVTVVTNTTPTGPYRGAGRPEAAALVERAVDLAAAALDMDPVELRRRNFPDPSRFPFTTATGATYDSGDYGAALDKALEMAGYDELRRQQQRRLDDPSAPLLGIGVACYVETSGRGSEFGSVSLEDDGTFTVVTGSVPHGQGHETVWAQIAASVLGVPMESVRVVHSDTARVDHGVGTFGSRSLQLAGSAVHRAAEAVLARARQVAAAMLEASPDDIVALGDGTLGVAGVPASGLRWEQLAAEAGRRQVALAQELDFESAGSFPFGCHIATVEIDRLTGRVRLADLVAVDDCGVVVNPLLAEGQVHGGLAQGVAQILFEHVAYDEAGNPLTATLVDYAIPSAPDMPSFRTAHTVTPSPNNPLGAKGIGESGTTGSVAAVWNAVVDGLRPFGLVHLDPPFTAEKVWRAMGCPA